MFRSFLLSISLLGLVAAAPVPQSFHRPLVFEPNHGQAPPNVKWTGRAPGYQLLLTTEGPVIALAESHVRMKLAGGHPWDEIRGLEPTGGISNYLFGSNRKHWHTGIPHYARLSAARVYDGVDMVFYSNAGELEYDFVVAPHADAKQIRLSFDGVDSLRVDAHSGDLLLTTASGSELRHMRPKVYQESGTERVVIAGGYEVLDRRQATLTLASYDQRRPLVIDPTVKFTTVLAGNSDDQVTASAVDGSGNVYVTGTTISTNFPKVGAYQGDRSEEDAFVTKLSPTGKILFSTYLGGDSVPIAGRPSAGQQRTYGGGSSDAFLARVAPDGLAIAFSTFVGGPNQDSGMAVAVDQTGSVYSTGYAEYGFPITTGLKPCGTNGNVFVARHKGPGTQPRYATCIETAVARSITVDAKFNAYITGDTSSIYPTTTRAFQRTKPSTGTETSSGIVTKLNTAGKIAYSTYFGGRNGVTYIYDIAVDRTGAAYLTGETTSNGFPGLPGLKPKPTAGFISKLNPQGSALVYSSTFATRLTSASLFQPSPTAPVQIYVAGVKGGGLPALTSQPDVIVLKLQ